MVGTGVGDDEVERLADLRCQCGDGVRIRHVDEHTFQEITSVSRALGQEDTGSLEATLNYLLTNRRQKIPSLHSLNSEEERILRYVQQSVSLNLMRDGVTPSVALDMASKT